MAKTNKTSTKAKGTKTKGKSKGKSKVEVVPDFCETYCDGNAELALYEKRNGGYSVKFTFCGAFALYGKVIILDDEERAFISYPSWRNKDGEYINFAFCFDKELIEQMNNDITDFIFGEE